MTSWSQLSPGGDGLLKHYRFVVALSLALGVVAVSRPARAFTIGQTGGGSETAVKNTSGSSWNAATTAGSLLVANLIVTDYTGTPTAPTGWTLAKSTAVTTVLKQYVYYRLNSAARTGTESFTLSTTTTFDYALNLVEYQGVDVTVAAADTNTFATATSSSGAGVSVTAGAAPPWDSSIVICAGGNDHGRSMTKTTGWTKDDTDRSTGTANPGSTIEHLVQTSIATPTCAWTVSATDASAVVLIFHGARKFWSSTSSTAFGTTANWKMSTGAAAPTAPADGDMVYFDGASSNASSIVTGDTGLGALFLQNGYAGTVTMQAPASGNDTLTITGPTAISSGTLTGGRNGTGVSKNGYLAFGGDLTQSGGTIDMGSGGIAASGNVTMSGGTLNATCASTCTGSNQLTTIAGTLTMTGGTLATAGGEIDVTGAATVSGASVVSVAAGVFNPQAGFSLAGTSTYTAASGTTSTFGGTLAIGGASAFDLGTGAMTVAGAMTVSGGSFKGGGTSTLASTLGVSSGSYDANGGASTVTGLVTLSGGTYKLGSSATGQTMSAGLTIAGGTLDGSLSTGALRIGAGKTLAMSSGTLQTSTGVTTGPTFSSTTTSTYAFSVTGGTVNVNGLAITGVNNSPGVSLTGGTLTRLDNVSFANVPTTNPASTSYLLTISVASLSLSTTGDKFDYSTTTFTNLKTIHLTDTGGAVGDVRVYLQCKDSATNGAACGDAADADEDTAPDDGVGDTGNHAVAYWTYAVATDTAGSIQGFPTAAFDWNTFTFYSVYVAYNDVAGAGSADRIYVRDASGNAVSTFDIPDANGNIVGTPLWNTEGTAHVVYVGTSKGKIYKLVDTGGTLAMAASPWNTVFTSGSVTSISSPLISDDTNLYFAGTNGATNDIFGVAISTNTLAKTVGSSATITAAPSWTTSAGVTYLFVGSAVSASQAYIYRVNMNPGAAVNATSLQATASVGSGTRLINGVLYAGDGNAKLHAIDALNFSSGGFADKTGFPYQDTVNHAPVTKGAISGAPYVDVGIGRIFFGDADGHLYELTTSGAIVANYPLKVSSSAITTSPVHVSSSGVVVVGDSAGNVYYVDLKNAASAPQVFYTQTMNAAVSSVAYDASAGQYMVGTTSGQFELLPAKADPTPTFTF